MSKRQFFEYEALEDVLVASQEKLNFEFDTDLLLEKLGEENVDLLNEAILELLKEKEFEPYITTIRTIPPPNLKEGFDLKLKSSKKDGVIQKITFWQVEESESSAIMYLVSLSYALITFNPQAVIMPTCGMLLNIWKNMMTLNKDEHEYAITVYEAILKIRLKKDATKYYIPSTLDIHQEVDLNDIKDTAKGIRQLHDKGLIKTVRWNEDENNYSYPKNTWDTSVLT